MKRIHWIMLIVVNLVFVILEFSGMSESGHQDFWWTSVPLFYMFYGFVGCMALVFVAKWVGDLFLLQKEDYYDA